jgi:hypothetical protein
MPWYRVKGQMVHLKIGGKKAPRACQEIIKLSDGRKEYCAQMAPYLCDWPAGGGRDCDFPMCEDHRKNVGPNKDYCPEHAADAECAQPGLFTGLIA